MKYYTIAVPFASVTVIPKDDGEGDPVAKEARGEYVLAVTASERGEIKVSSVGKSLLPSPLAALAAGRFLSGVRGVPIEEAEVEYDGDILTAYIDHKTGEIKTKLHKCKQTLSKERVFVHNIEVECTDYLCDNVRIRLVGCAEDMPEEQTLRMLLLREGMPLADAVAAYTVKDGELLIRSVCKGGGDAVHSLGAVSAAARELSLRGAFGRLWLSPRHLGAVELLGGETVLVSLSSEILSGIGEPS